MPVDVELLYRQHLTADDRRLLRSVSGAETSLSAALALPEAATAVLSPGIAGLVGVSPFLTFAVAVHATARRVGETNFVEERWTSRVRIPVFDVGPLRELVAEPLRRFFLAELLSSYTRVHSGAVWGRTTRGWRRRRFSELDPVRLAGLLEVVDAAERPGIYRRLGDLCLFLTGVFPDSRSVLGVDTIAAARLARRAGLQGQLDDYEEASGLLGLVGPRFYRLARKVTKEAGLPVTANLLLAGEMGERFNEARRFLNLVTDTYLFPWREPLFGAA